MKQPRKASKFEYCDKHRWLKSMRPYRRAEYFCEGGPAEVQPGCEGGLCRLWPGTDLFVPEVCDGSEYPLPWTKPALIRP